MKLYIYQNDDWPNFFWDKEKLFDLLVTVRNLQGQLIGKMNGLGFDFKNEAELETLTVDILKSNEIEGQILNPEQVRSSLARRLGLEVSGLINSDREVDGVVDMMLDATKNFNIPLTKDRLFNWHSSLFPTGRSLMRKIIVGNWRNDAAGPVQVVSGGFGKEKIHFQAPDSNLIVSNYKN